MKKIRLLFQLLLSTPSSYRRQHLSQDPFRHRFYSMKSLLFINFGLAQTVYYEGATILVQSSKPTQPYLVDPYGKTHPPLAESVGDLYNFYIEPYFKSGKYHLRFEEDGTVIDTPLVLTIQTQKRQFDMPFIMNPIEANFANHLMLLGYELPEQVVKLGDSLSLTLHWQASQYIGADLIFFVHLIGPDGQRWAGQDRKAQDLYSTMLWAPQEIVSDSFTLEIDPNIPSGTYQLLVGVYLPMGNTAVSLPLVEQGQFAEISHVNLREIQVIDRTSP